MAWTAGNDECILQRGVKLEPLRQRGRFAADRQVQGSFLDALQQVVDGDFVNIDGGARVQGAVGRNGGRQQPVDARRDAALIFKEAAREVGINVDVVPQEWSIYIDNQKKHNFEMYYGAWISGVGESDPKQIFHTESINGGSNYCYFGNAESDALIEALRSELDKDKRAYYYKALQAIIHDEVPYIFLSAPLERIAISKKFFGPNMGWLSLIWLAALDGLVSTTFFWLCEILMASKLIKLV